jgi:predicted dehydrogenase
MDRIKIGIIGLGMAWERLHAPAFARLSDKFEITAVCDKDMNKAREVAAWINLPVEAAYDDYLIMLKKADMEAVDTMVPIQENYECAAAVLKHGKHLIAEKPFASSPDAAKQLIKLKNRKITVMTRKICSLRTLSTNTASAIPSISSTTT